MAKRSVRLQSPRARFEEPSDAELVRRFLAGDELAFNELYSRHRQRMYEDALVLLKGDPDVAEEIVEVCWLKVLRNLSTFNGRGAFEGWVYRILRNLIKDQYKKGAYKYCETFPPGFEFEEWCPPHPSLDPLEQLIQKEEVDRVMARLGSLPTSLHMSFVLVHIEGRPYGEVAGMLDTTVGALKMRIHRARLALQEVVTR